MIMLLKRISFFLFLIISSFFLSACSKVGSGALNSNLASSKYSSEAPPGYSPPGYYRLSSEERARLSPSPNFSNQGLDSKINEKHNNKKESPLDSDSYIKSSKDRIAGIISGEVEPPSPEEYQAEMTELSKRWFFGPGFGSACLNIFLAVSYPPYAIYILGNAGLELSGIGALYPTDLLPEKPAQALSKGYSKVVSVPGRVNAFIFNEEFRDPFVLNNSNLNHSSFKLLNSPNNSF